MISKLKSLKLALIDADRRFNIAICKMSEITKRVHELEIERNKALRKEFLINEIKNNPKLSKALTKELDKIYADNKYIVTYQEVIQGYKSMSRRKNDLEEERNIYVYDIEKEINKNEKKIK